MAISQETLKHLAHLARIELKPEELDTLSGQLKDVLDFIDKLKQLDTSKTTPTSHILPMNNVLRKDSPDKSLDITATMGNAPQKDGDFFVVPKIIV